MAEITRRLISEVVHALADDNRHTESMWLVARLFGYQDLKREFARLRAECRRLGDWTEEMNARRYDAFKEMRQRVVAVHGWDLWVNVWSGNA